MPRGPKTTVPLALTDDVRAKLLDRAGRPTSQQRLAQRARIVLAADFRVTPPTFRK